MRRRRAARRRRRGWPGGSRGAGRGSRESLREGFPTCRWMPHGAAGGRMASGGDAEMPQHRVDARRTAPEGLEAVERVAAAAHLEDLLPVAPAGVEVQHAGLLERAERVRR